MSTQRAKRGRKASKAIENDPNLRSHTIKVNEKVCVSSTSLFPCRLLEEAPLNEENSSVDSSFLSENSTLSTDNKNENFMKGMNCTVEISENSVISTDNTYKNFMKIMNCNVEISSNDVKDCQELLKKNYEVKKKKFQLFFNNDRSEAQHDKSAIESVKPSTDSVSIEERKKILETLPKEFETLKNIRIKKEPLEDL